MHQLQLALDEDEELRRDVAALSERIAGNPLKHALILDLNPFWDAAQRYEAAGFSPDLLYRWLREFGIATPLPLPRAVGFTDLSHRDHFAEHLTERVFGSRRRATPYMLRIFAAPARSRGDLEWRGELVRAAREAALPTLVETEERATYVANPGDKLAAGGKSGTLGGFLRDGPGGPTYAVTCGHVVSPGVVSSGGAPLGTCSKAQAPIPLGTAVCTTGCPNMTRLDVALIDIGSAPVANVATAEAKIVHRGDLVEMHGAASGKVTYEIGGTVVEMNVAGSCWDRLYVLHAPTAGIFPMAVNVADTPLPQPGDSGSWVLRNSTEWAGMVVAKSGLHGYALPETVVLAESDLAFRTSLQLA